MKFLQLQNMAHKESSTASRGSGVMRTRWCSISTSLSRKFRVGHTAPDIQAQTIKTMPLFSAGFTFVETLVAITVLLLAITAPLSIGSEGLTASRVAKHQVTAVYLIQDAIEYIRYVRDTNSLNTTASWLEGLSECMNGSSCRIDTRRDITNTLAVQTCTGSCPVISTNSTSYLYGYDATWNATVFTRTIEITEAQAGSEAIVTVQVSWQDGRVTRTLAIEERLFDWQ
jgi:Tfp pilus assembly protein PilV